MHSLLRPDIRVKSILEVPLHKLREKGINSLIIDLDNTITEWNKHEVSREAARWFTAIKKQGFRACLVSNNRGERVATIARSLDIPSISKAAKPRRKAFRQALKLLKVERCQTAVVGDQLFTDILGGNRMGMFTILVEPISTHEFLGTRFMRVFERIISRGWD